jgi:hypothetical protein
LTAGQVLDELEFLATVEHALVVEYLSVQCALGHNLEADEGGPITKQGHAARDAASALALGGMTFRLKAISLALVDAGRSAQLGRARSISTAHAGEISLEPPGVAELERLLEREEAIAQAVDERYVRLGSAITSDPIFEGDVLDEMRRIIVDEGPTHAAELRTLRDSLADVEPAELLRATRREASDSFEGRLLDVSDRSYWLVLAVLQQRFAPDSGAFFGLAVSAMDGLDEINRALVQRGLLPRFTL